MPEGRACGGSLPAQGHDSSPMGPVARHARVGRGEKTPDLTLSRVKEAVDLP